MGQSDKSKSVWEAFLRLWVRPYTGYPDKIHDNHGPQFQSTEWEGYFRAAGIKPQDSGVEIHNVLGAGEHYHEYLRQIFRKVQLESFELSKEEALSIVVHAMNCTAGSNGISPILLVFEIVPRMPVRPDELLEQRQRMNALNKAGKEMRKILAKRRIGTARRMNVPCAAARDIRPGMKVLFYREIPVNKCTGSFVVIAVDNKKVWLNVGDRISLALIDKLKEYRTALPSTPEATPEPMSPQTQQEAVHNLPLVQLQSVPLENTSTTQGTVGEFNRAIDSIAVADTIYSNG